MHHSTDFSSSSVRDIFTIVRPDLVISTISGGNYDLQKTIIDCAIESGVQRFIPAEFGQDTLNEQIQERLPPSRERARVIEYLREKAAESRIKWVGVATGSLLDNGIISGDLGFDLKWQSATVHGNGTETFAASSTAWVGEIVSAVVEHWEEVKNHYIYAAGVITSANDVVKGLEEKTGQTWENGYVDAEETVHEAERRIDRGFPDAGMFLMERSVLYDERLRAVKPFVDDDAKGKLGLTGERLENITEHVVHEYKHHGKADCGCG